MKLKLFTLLNTLFFIFLAETSFSQTTETFTTIGTTTWTVPPCVTEITVKVWGAGGGGGGTSSHQTGSGDPYEACTGGGGGGGGGYAQRTYNVTPGDVYSIVVGAGGTIGIGTNNNGPAGNGGTGGTSTFSGPATAIPGVLTATGGTGGGGATADNTGGNGHIGDNGAGGAGGVGSNGSLNASGGSGSGGSNSGSCHDLSGAGGAAGSSGGNGANGQFIGPCPHTSAMAGGAGNNGGGSGGNGIQGNINASRHVVNGNAGSNYGGGGGGGNIHLNSWPNSWQRSNGGAGAQGVVIIEYTDNKPAPPIVTSSPATCTKDGSSTIVGYTGNPGDYTFNPAATIGTGGVVIGTAGTTYTVTYTSSPGCSSDPTTFTIPAQLPIPTDPTINVAAPTCSSNGTATIAGYSGNPSNYTITPSAGVSIGAGGVINGLTPGTSYTISATNGSCSSGDVSFIVDPKYDAPDVPTVQITDSDCDNDGSGRLTNHSGSNTYTFNPNHTITFGINGEINGATPGTSYTITATNSNGCTSSSSFTIPTKKPTPPAPVISITAADCGTPGSAQITNYSGSNSYSFNPGGPSIAFGLGSTRNINSATPGTLYTIIATRDGCSSSSTFTVPPAKTVPVSPNPVITAPTCSSNGTGYIQNYSTGVTYVVNPSTASIDIAGNIINATYGQSYTVTAVDNDSGCPSAPATFTINAQLETPIVTISAENNEICNGASVLLTAGGSATSFTWTPGGSTGSTLNATPTTNTTYSVTGSLSNGCSDTKYVTITVNPTPVINGTPNISPADCNASNGSITGLSASGGTPGYTYSWIDGGGTPSGSDANLTNVPAGAYTLTITDDKGCTDVVGPINITNPNAPDAPNVNAISADCDNNGTATISNYDPNNTYTFSDPNITVNSSGVISGYSYETNYSVTATFAGCTSGTEFFLVEEQLANPIVTITASESEICEGTQVTLTASGADSYSWDTGSSDLSITVNPSTTTTYNLTGTLSNTCTDNTSITITVNPNPSITGTAISLDSDCDIDNGSISGLASSGGTGSLSYSWENTSGTVVGTSADLSGVPAGNYTLTVTDSKGCSDTYGPVTIINPNAPDEPIVDITSATCDDDGSAAIDNYDANNTYTFSDPSVTVDASGAITGVTTGTTYTVTSTESGCTSTIATFSIDAQYPHPTVDLTANTTEICLGEDVTLTASGADDYTWNEGLNDDDTHIVSPTSNTTYTVTGTENINGCSSDASITIIIKPEPSIEAWASSIEVCEGDAIHLFADTINPSSDVTYSWTGPNGFTSTDQNPTITPSENDNDGTYYITGTATNGCGIAIDSVTIIVHPVPNSGSLTESEINSCAGSDLTLTITNPDAGTNYVWSYDGDIIGSGNSYDISSPGTSNSGTYTVYAENEFGCHGLVETIEVEITVCDLEIVEAFSPNGDGVNEYFTISNLEAYPNTEIWIYTRWGLEVYHSEDYKNDWDGKSQNSLNLGDDILPEGTYYYLIKLGGEENTPKSGEEIKGFVYLKR